MKCATVTVVGRPSVGKSTLVNTICEAKVSITSPSPQTTRNAIRGIYTDTRGQLIFTDTPGLHISGKDFNRRMQDIAVKSLDESDIVLYIADATRSPKAEEDQITDILRNLKAPVVCCINKSDIITESQEEVFTSYINKRLPGCDVYKISALKDDGVDDLLIALYSHAPESPVLYDEETRTDQNLEFRISEIIREKAINSVHDEIPSAIMVDVSDIEYCSETSKVWIRAFIVVERDSQKGILIGKEGSNIKKIRKASFSDIKRVFPSCEVYLDLRVKVDSSWKSNNVLLSRVFRDTYES